MKEENDILLKKLEYAIKNKDTSFFNNNILKYKRIKEHEDSLICNAAYYGNFEAFKTLVKLKHNYMARNNFPLIYSSQFGHINIIKYLLTLDKITPEVNNSEAFIRAADFGHIDIVKFFLTYPSVNINAKSGQALYMSILNKHEKVYNYLLKQPNISADYNTLIVAIESNINPKLIKIIFSKLSSENIIEFKNKYPEYYNKTLILLNFMLF